ncbi:hypothetical protein LCGC14_0635900 [marine sediment metagenome]|uniref:Uncharacterized protein n=1 Tax=marine sediment metagenome TaxID=412755 RepID=A0A0F9RJS5_9ZZZZ
MGINGLGRKAASEDYDDPKEYLNKHIFPIVDSLDQFKKDLIKAEKLLSAAKYRLSLQQQKLDYAYLGLEKWRRK